MAIQNTASNKTFTPAAGWMNLTAHTLEKGKLVPVLRKGKEVRLKTGAMLEEGTLVSDQYLKAARANPEKQFIFIGSVHLTESEVASDDEDWGL